MLVFGSATFCISRKHSVGREGGSLGLGVTGAEAAGADGPAECSGQTTLTRTPGDSGTTEPVSALVACVTALPATWYSSLGRRRFECACWVAFGSHTGIVWREFRRAVMVWCVEARVVLVPDLAVVVVNWERGGVGTFWCDAENVDVAPPRAVGDVLVRRFLFAL